MGEGEKYNFYVHSDIKEKVVIINITLMIILIHWATLLLSVCNQKKCFLVQDIWNAVLTIDHFVSSQARVLLVHIYT